jgi:hypothetical protein
MEKLTQITPNYFLAYFMKKLFTFLFLLTLFGSCSKKDDSSPVVPGGLVGTTWIGSVYKDQFMGKDTYNYFTFKTSNAVESYSKYNKTDLATAPVVSTYEYNPPNLIISFNGASLSTVVTGNTFTLRYYNMDFVYEKEK